jgi:hypothetical protein
MEIIDFLGIDSSRLNADIVVDKIMEDPDRLEEVWKLTTKDAYPLSMRAARVIWLLAKKQPQMIEPYIPEMVQRLKVLKTTGVKRNFINILSVLPIPVKYTGILFEMCLGWIDATNESIAVKANAMSILYTISNTEPELKPELIAILESLIPSESSGIEARADKLLAKLYKETR